MTYRLFYLFLLFAPFFIHASTTEFRVGYYYPQSNLMRDIYQNGGVEFEFENTVLISRYIDLWANINYFQRDGRSLGLSDKTSVKLIPVSLGFKYLYACANYWNIYLGIGGSYTWARFHDQSSYVEKHPRKQAFGWVVKSGIIHYLQPCLYLNLFADYYSTSIAGVHQNGVEGTACNVGGLRTGVGIGTSY